MDECCRKIYDKICRCAGKLVETGCAIERELGIPIVNKRISVSPISLVAAACREEDYTPVALTLDRAAHETGVNFIGGFSALAHKGFYEKRPASYQLHPRRAHADGARLFEREPRLDESGHKHGRRRAHGQDNKADRGH